MNGSDYFLKLDGISGESQDARHKDEVEVASWSWGEEQTIIASGGGGSAGGKVSMRDFQFTMRVNRATPQLIAACASGKPIKTVVLTGRRTGGAKFEFLKYTFSDAIVSSYGSAASEGGLPMEQVSLNYAQIEVEYKEQRPDGSAGATHKAGWNRQANKPV
ncbi:MAG: Hcp family type VI secretion system effector [Burkholderiales bacterium]